MLALLPRVQQLIGLICYAVAMLLLIAFLVPHLSKLVPRYEAALKRPLAAEVYQTRTPKVASAEDLADISGTETEISIFVPQAISMGSTRHASVEVEKFMLGSPTEQRQRVETIDHDVAIALKSSGFEIEGFSTLQAGTRFPLLFRWTLSPKAEGEHEILVDLSQILEKSEVAFSTFTQIRMDDSDFETLKEHIVPISITVDGQFWLPTWSLGVGAAGFAFFGFVLQHPIVVDWLKRKIEKRNARIKPKKHKRSRWRR